MNFTLNEFIFVGWALGILQAKLIKKVKLDIGFTVYNFILCIVFWTGTKYFIHVEPAKTWFGDAVQFVIYLVIGFGAYKIFQGLMNAGTGKVLSTIKETFQTKKTVTTLIEKESEVTNDKAKDSNIDS